MKFEVKDAKMSGFEYKQSSSSSSRDYKVGVKPPGWKVGGSSSSSHGKKGGNNYSAGVKVPSGKVDFKPPGIKMKKSSSSSSSGKRNI